MNPNSELLRRRGGRHSPVLRADVPPRVRALLNRRNEGCGLWLLHLLGPATVPLVVFDPQYREIMDRQNYGNEGDRQQARAALRQMSADQITAMLHRVATVLRPSGHLMRWVDKFTLVEGRTHVPGLQRVGMIVSRKHRIGMGKRERYRSEYLVIYQKPPIRAKGIWTDHNISDVHEEPFGWESEYLDWPVTPGPHRKPVSLQARLIGATTKAGELVVDPTAGSYSVFDAARFMGRNFLGCNLR